MRDFIVSVYQSMPNDIKENEVRDTSFRSLGAPSCTDDNSSFNRAVELHFVSRVSSRIFFGQ